MASERARADWDDEPGEGGVMSPGVLSAVAVAMAAFVGALLGCQRRTSRLARQISELSVLSRTDPLTGLHNRRHVEEHLAGALSAARRHCQPLSVLFIDVDDFKAINDAHGHLAGDDVLRAIAKVLREACRPDDEPARYGGEEFALVVPRVGREELQAVADRLRNAIAARPLRLREDLDLPLTVSVGAATLGGDALDRTVLIASADAALYEAKRLGKNRTVLAPDGLPEKLEQVL